MTTFACSRRRQASGSRAPSSLHFLLPYSARGHLALPTLPLLARWLLLSCLLLPAGPAAGQLIGGPIVPAGHLRLDIHPNFITWNERFGLRGAAGSLVEEVEPLGWSLSSDALGSDRLPGAARSEAHLRTLLQNPDYRYNLGRTTHLLAAHVRRVPLGFQLGVFPWLSVGASLPMVQRKLDSELILVPGDANAGLAPSQSASALFLSQYLTALSTTRIVVDGQCAASGDSAECMEGQALVQSADALLGALSPLYGESLYLPVEGSDAGQALNALLNEVRGGMSNIGLTFADPLPLGTPLDQASFDSLIVAPVFGRQGLPLRGQEGLWEPGDLEVNLAVRLLNTMPRPADTDGPQPPGDSLAGVEEDAGGSFGVQLGVAGTLRLGTGTPQDTLRDFLDMDIAEGQMDIEVRGFGNLGWARRAGVAFDVRYGIASPARIRRRIAKPDIGFARAPVLDTVQWTPGNYLDYAITPHVLLTPQLSFGFVYRSYSRGADTYEGDGADLAPLSLETEATVQSMGVDVRYSSFLGGGFPVEVRFGWESARSGTGGRTPKTGIVRFGASLFRRIWGGG